MRNKQNIISSLNNSAIIDGYSSIPIYTYINSKQWEYDLDYASCNYCVKHFKSWEDSTFENALWLRDQMAPYYG